MGNYAASRVTDPVFCEADVHGIPPFFIPLPVLGKITQGSDDTLVNDRQAVRMGDSGTHRFCPGPNTFLMASGASRTFVNDRPKCRDVDKTLHCGSITNPGTSYGSAMDGLGSPNTFVEKP